MTPPRTVYRVLQQAAPTTLAGIARDEFRYGAKILYVEGPAPVEPVEVEGIVVHSTLEEAAHYIGTSNPLLEHLGAFQRIEHDKYFEAQLVRSVAPEAFAQTELVSDVWPRGAVADVDARLQQIEAEMHARYPTGFVLKPITSFATDGKFPSERTPFCALYASYLAEAKPAAERLAAAGADPTEAHLELNKLPSYPGRVLEAVLTAPETVLIQQRLDLAMVDGVIDEYRVHVVGGKVLERATEHRWDNYRAIAPARIREAEALVASVIPRLPAPYDALTYGVDVVRLADDTFRIMELNPGWESQYFYAEYDAWVANLLAAHYAGAPTTLLAKFGRFQRARSIPTKLQHLKQLVGHRALVGADRASISEILAQAAHVLVAELAQADAEDQTLILDALKQLELEPYLTRGEVRRVRGVQRAIAVAA